MDAIPQGLALALLALLPQRNEEDWAKTLKRLGGEQIWQVDGGPIDWYHCDRYSPFLLWLSRKDKRVAINLRTGKEEPMLSLPHQRCVGSDGVRAYCELDSPQLRCYELGSGKTLWTSEELRWGKIEFCNAVPYLKSSDGSSYIFDPETGKTLKIAWDIGDCHDGCVLQWKVESVPKVQSIRIRDGKLLWEKTLSPNGWRVDRVNHLVEENGISQRSVQTLYQWTMGKEIGKFKNLLCVSPDGQYALCSDHIEAMQGGDLRIQLMANGDPEYSKFISIEDPSLIGIVTSQFFVADAKEKRVLWSYTWSDSLGKGEHRQVEWSSNCLAVQDGNTCYQLNARTGKELCRHMDCYLDRVVGKLIFVEKQMFDLEKQVIDSEQGNERVDLPEGAWLTSDSALFWDKKGRISRWQFKH